MIVPRNGTSPFDTLRRVNASGQDYWSARDLQELLGYETWRSFADSIERARLACENSGQDARDHFAAASKMIKAGKGAERDVLDFHLTRYACHLVAMNGDPRKAEIANAQTYFSVMTHQAEQMRAAPAQPALSAAVGMDFLQQFAGNVVIAIQQQAATTKDEVKAELRQEFTQQIGGLPATGQQRAKVRNLVRQIVGQRTRLGLPGNNYSAAYTEVWDACGVGRMDTLTRDEFPKVQAYLEAQLASLGVMTDSGLFGGEG